MTATEPQAAPPETDLRDRLANVLTEQMRHPGAVYSINSLTDAILAAGFIRPDALREKVMQAIEETLTDPEYAVGNATFNEGVRATRAAVAAVLEAES